MDVKTRFTKLLRLSAEPAPRLPTNDQVASFLRIYYAVGATVLFTSVYRLFSVLLPQTHDWPWPMKWMRLFPDQRPVAFLIFFAVTFCALVAALRPTIRWPRIFFALLLFLLIPIYYAGSGEFYHEYYTWMFTAFCLAPIGFSSAQENQEKNAFFLRAALFSAMSIYFLCALWKVREAVVFLAEGGELGQLFSSIGFGVANNVTQGGSLTPLGASFAELPAWIQGPPWVAATLLELVCLPAVFFPRLIPIVGALLLAFHGGTALILDIPYTATVYLVALLCFASPTSAPDGRRSS